MVQRKMRLKPGVWGPSHLQKPVDIEKLIITLKNAYKKKMEDTMVAATFAEAGEFQTAREIMDEKKKDK